VKATYQYLFLLSVFPHSWLFVSFISPLSSSDRELTSVRSGPASLPSYLPFRVPANTLQCAETGNLKARSGLHDPAGG